jgi:hypothetical protein
LLEVTVEVGERRPNDSSKIQECFFVDLIPAEDAADSQRTARVANTQRSGLVMFEKILRRVGMASTKDKEGLQNELS